MSECIEIRSHFSSYLDGAVSGATMQQIAQHLESCAECAADFASWRQTQAILGSIGPAKAPSDFGLRLRIALSHEAANTPAEAFARWRVRWHNSFRPLVLQASAGLASTVLLLGSITLLVGMFASPEPLSARDEPLGMASSPRFLYSSMNMDQAVGYRDNPLVVEAFIDRQGRVYDYKIVSGATDAKTRSQLEDILLFSVFEPARDFGEPVAGTLVMSYSGVAVHG